MPKTAETTKRVDLLGTRQARSAAHTREGMLHAAARALARHGLEATTMQQIAREAGYTVPSLYAYFNGRQDIIDALLERLGGEVVRTFADPMPAGLTFPQKLELLLQRQLEFGEQWREAFVVMFAAKAGGRPGAAKSDAVSHDSYVELLAHWLEATARPEEIGGRDTEEFACILEGILHATFQRWLQTGRPRRLVDHASSIVDLLRYGMSGPTRAEAEIETADILEA